MGTHAKKINKLNFLLFVVVSFALVVSSLQVLLPSNTFAAPTTPTKETCEAAGGKWVNLAPTGGVPKMGCSGASLASQQSLDWQVQSLLYYRTMGKCFNQATRTSIKYDAMKSGEWFQDGWVAIGPYMRDVFSDVGDDSVMACFGDTGKDFVNKALSLWGIKGRDLLCGAGFTWNQFPNNKARCQDSSIGSGDFLAYAFTSNTGGPNPGTDGWIAGGEANVLKYIRDKIYSGATPTLSNAGWYQFYRKVFFQQCDTTQKMSGGTTTKPSGTDKRDVKLTIVADDGSKVDKWYRIDAGMADNSFTTRLGDPTGYSDVKKTCQEVAKLINDNADVYARTIQNTPRAGDPATPGGTDGGAEDEKSSCVIPGVGWIICPVTTFLADIADNAFTFLTDNFLQVDVNTISTSSPTFSVWASMRSIANVAFVIAFLFIIFSQLTGQGIANYGIKKMLPRLIVAAILVNVSFFICQIAVDLSNILGVSIKQAFDAAGGGIQLPAGIGDESGNWAGIAVAVIAGTGIAWGLGISVLLPFLVVAVIAFIMVFLILVVRQVLIILLIVVAPIAFVAFLLPNTEQWFTKWRKMFVGLLLVFPMIGLLFGAAGLASKVINAAAYASGDDTSGWIAKIIAAGVIALPLFLLPSLLKNSLNAAGSLGNTIQNLGRKAQGAAKGATKKAYDRSRLGQFEKYRSGVKARRRAQIMGGSYEGKGGKLNPRNWSSQINGAINDVSGGFGAHMSAQGIAFSNEEQAKEIAATEQKLRRSSLTNPSAASDALVAALKSGDTTAAKAAQNVLFSQGGGGVGRFFEAVQSTGSAANTKVLDALRENINERHGQYIKSKAADMTSWAAKGGTIGADDHLNALSGLSESDLASQTAATMQRAQQSINPATAQSLLNNKQLSGNLDPEQRAVLEKVVARGATGGTNTVDSSASQRAQAATGATAAAAPAAQTVQQAATEQQNALSAAQRAKETAARASQGTAGDGIFVVEHGGDVTHQQPAQPAETQAPSNQPPSTPPSVPPTTPSGQ